MANERPKPRGRPPREPGPPATYHLGLRFNPHRKEQILRAVDEANERARAAGVPANITPSGLVTMWIVERLDQEVGTLTPARKRRT